MDPITLGLVGALHQPLSDNSFDGYDAHAAGAYIGYNDFRLEVGYERGRYNLVGQQSAKVTGATIGIDYKVDLNHRFSVHAGTGYWHPVQTDILPVIRDEVAFTYLVNRHHVEGLKPIPLEQITKPDGTTDYAPCGDWGGVYYPDQCYSSNFEIGGGVYLKVGLEYKITEWLLVGFDYRYLRPDSTIELFDPERKANNEGWWMEAGFMQMDSASLSFKIEF